MLKFNKVLPFIMYFFIVLIYVYSLMPAVESISFFYQDILIFITIFILYNIYIQDYELNKLILYRYKKCQKYIVEKIIKFSIKNLIFMGILSVMNIIIACFLTLEVNIVLVLYFGVQLFIILEIMFIFLLAASLKNKTNITRYIIIVIMAILFLLSKLDYILPFNVFYFFFTHGNMLEMIFYYIFWIFGAYLYIVQIQQKIEL